jgi:hypothetical protein
LGPCFLNFLKSLAPQRFGDFEPSASLFRFTRIQRHRVYRCHDSPLAHRVTFVQIDPIRSACNRS